jgi:hypothetical protein
LGVEGRGDLVSDAPNDPKVPRGDLSADTARGFGNAPHITNAKYVKSTKTVTLTVRQPHTGTTLNYEVYRSPGGLPLTESSITQRVLLGTFPAGSSSSIEVADVGVLPNRLFTYYAVAIQENPEDPTATIRSGISNFKVVNTK